MTLLICPQLKRQCPCKDFGSIKELKFAFDFEATKFSSYWKILPHCKCQYTRFLDKIKQKDKQTKYTLEVIIYMYM